MTERLSWASDRLWDEDDEEAAAASSERRRRCRRWRKGDAAVARFAEDGFWYRAMVVEDAAEGEKTVAIQFVDFGNPRRVSADGQIRAPAPGEFAHVPILAIR